MTGNTTENLNRILECPVCFEEFDKKEVFQCQDGHTVCSNCISKCPKCPTCRTVMPRKRIRNRAIEFITSQSGTIVAGPQPSDDVPVTTSTPVPVPVTVSKAKASGSTTGPLPKKQNRGVVHNAYCDGPNCQSHREGTENAQKIHGIRYKCVICNDYDLCEDCMTTRIHKHHAFMVFKTSKQFEKYDEQQQLAHEN